jgi:predicted DNA-binding transcriptional regulator AlpA
LAKDLPRAVAVLLKRFGELSEQEQLLAYEACRDYLAAGRREVVRDLALDERAEVLRVMRQVVEHYKLTDPQQLEIKQFDQATEAIREGWRSGRIIRVFGTWRLARNALAGARPRQTAHQRAIRRQAALHQLTTDDYFAGVREWLATKPPSESITHYTEWVAEKNASLAPGELRVAAPLSIRTALRLGWKSIVLIAKGELRLEDAQRRRAARRLAVSRGKHDFVSHRDIVEMSGKAASSVYALSHKPDFPTAVLVIDNRRHYLREDVIAYLTKKPFPKRERDELRPLYLSSAEVAALAGLRVTQWENIVRQELQDVPSPIAAVGARRLWLRSEIEAWIKGQGKRRGSSQERSATNSPDKKRPTEQKTEKVSR